MADTVLLPTKEIINILVWINNRRHEYLVLLERTRPKEGEITNWSITNRIAWNDLLTVQAVEQMILRGLMINYTPTGVIE